MLPKTLMICVLDLLAARAVCGWNHAERGQFESITIVAPWTEPSKALELEWLSATARTPKSLISIDCTVIIDLCKEHKIISYPTIRLFRADGTTSRYRGPRKASSIISFLNRVTRPTVSLIDKKNTTTFRSIDEAVFIAYLPSTNGHLYSAFTSLAKRYSDKFTFAITTDSSLQHEGLRFPSIFCYKPQGGEQVVFPEEGGLDALQKFIETATTPTVGEFTRRNEMKYMKAGKSLVYFFTSDEETRSAYIASVTPLAKIYKEYLNFVTVDAAEYGHMLPTLGLEAGREPALAVFNPMYGQVFPFEGKHVTAKAVEIFVTDIAQGKVQPLGSGEKKSHGHTEL